MNDDSFPTLTLVAHGVGAGGELCRDVRRVTDHGMAVRG